MTKLLEHAVETARSLSPDRQDDIARLMLSFVDSHDGSVGLTREARLSALEAALSRGLADAEAGRVTPLDEAFQRLRAELDLPVKDVRA